MRPRRAKHVTPDRWNPSAIREQLSQIAVMFLTKGMTAKGLERLIRYTFTSVATRDSTFVNGKINYSRVAARTGLTRAEVKRVLSASVDPWLEMRDGPLARVIQGWTTDRHFTDQQHQPKRLVVSGARCSFANLVRKYAKDVPHKAMLDELRRIGAVAVRGTTVHL